jgi:Fe2+ or Zn2+ uptake regulation protein
MMRYSKQREEILKEIKGRRDHPSAAQMHAAVRRELPAISLGTVYRVLNKLAAEGAVLRLTMPDGKDRYDGYTPAHQHAFCRGCGEILDAELPRGEMVAAEFASQNKFAVEELQICMIGKCKKCQQARKG